MISCPYCHKPIPEGTTWCATCGANITPKRGRYPIHAFWIVSAFVIAPFAASGGCVAKSAASLACFVVSGMLILIGGTLLLINIVKGRQ